MLSKHLTVTILFLFTASSSLAASSLQVRELPPGATLEDLESWTLTSSTTATAHKAGTRLYLYGEPGTLEGTFQGANGAPDWQGWWSLDETQILNHWHVSTFNAENLNGNGMGNQAMWCGVESDPMWAGAPGYGNSWNDALEWRSGPLADPSAGQTVGLDLFFNHETEPGYDFFEVQYEKNGVWTTVYAVDETNKDIDDVFAPPGVQYSLVGASPIVYDGNDYGGENGDEIALRLVTASDGAFSDQDGFFPTIAGAAQVDDITVSYEDAGPQIDFTDFEGAGPFRWRTVETPFVGDFAKILLELTDLDPCRENHTAQMTFIDNGMPPNNAPGESTGGSTSEQFDYGTAGGWTLNDTGGLAGEGYFLRNVVWSPVIPRSLSPGEGVDFKYVLEYEVFDHHTAIQPGVFPLLGISQAGILFGERDIGSLIFFAPAAPRYSNRSVDLTDHVFSWVQYLRVGFRVIDFSDFLGHPVDATPAPFLDNVRVYKEVSGPRISLDVWNAFQDAFPAGAGLDVSTQVARDALDVAVDASQDNAFGDGNALIVSARSVRQLDNVEIGEVALHWVLDKNPLFEDAIRSMPPGSTVSVGTGPNGWDQVMGVAVPTQFDEERFWFDLPDVDFFYPGDKLRYYVWAQSQGSIYGNGPVSTLPEDISGFQSGEGYDPFFEVRALPSITDAAGTQPEILVAVYAPRTSLPVMVSSLGQIGLQADADFDYFQARDTLRPALASPNQGATPEQLAGYSCIVLSAERTPDELDYGLLESWHAEPGDKLAIHLGDDVVSAAPTSYRSGILGLQLVGSSVTSFIEGQTAPLVLPQQVGFTTQFVSNAGCYGRGFDAIVPAGSATTLHAYELLGGGGVYTTAVASVLHDRTDGEGDRILDVALPMGFEAIEDEHAKVPGASARSELLAELLALAGHTGGPPTPSPLPRTAGLFDVQSRPNPFNPRTEIRFRLGRAEDVRVRVFDVRGRHVVDLHRGPLAAGSHALPWSGLDADGGPVGSGVYFVRVEAGTFAQNLKVTLLE